MGRGKGSVQEHLKRYYLEYKIQGRRGWPQMQSHARHIEGYFGRMAVQSVKADTLRLYVLSRQEAGAANATINRELAVLKTALKMAYDEELLDRVPKFPTLVENNIRQGTFSREEVERLCAALPGYLQPVVWYAYYTGRRQGEILALRWEDIDLKARVVRVRQSTTKTGEPDRVPLQGELYELLLDLWEKRQERCPWVFNRNGQPIGPCSHAIKRAAKEVGLEGRVFHDLRRSMATDATEAGIDQSTIMRITGHKTAKVFARYRIVKTEGVRNALDKVAEYRKQQGGEG